MSFKSSFGTLEATGGSWLGFGILILIWIWSRVFDTHLFRIWCWRCQEHPCPLSPDLGLLRTLGVPECSLASWSLFGYGHWSMIHPWSKFWLSILVLKVQRTLLSFKSSFGALEDAGGSWLRFGFLILNFIWSLDFGTPMHWILNLYIDFEDAENIHVLLVLILGFEDTGGSWLRFGILILICIWSPAFDTLMFQIFSV